MTRTLLILTLALSMLACSVAPSTPPPVSVDLSGAAALYVQAPSGARSILAPDGATLMKLLTSGTVGEAVFEDALGAQVTVSVTRTHQLNAEYLLAELDYGEATLTAMVTLSTGELRAPPVAIDNWERIRVVGDTAYYVSGGALYRVELDALAATDMSQGDRISASSALYLDAQDNVHTFYLVNGSIDPLNQVRIYYADGSPFDALGWGSPTAYRLCDPPAGMTVLEDRDTGNVFFLWTTGTTGLRAIPVTFDASGVYEGVVQILDASMTAAHDVLLPDGGYLQDAAFADETRLSALTVAGGAITACTTRTASAMIYDCPRRYVDGALYVAYAAGGVSRLDVAAGTEAQIIDDMGIAALEIVGGDVFYSLADGTYKYDQDTDTTEKVSENPAEILAVTR